MTLWALPLGRLAAFAALGAADFLLTAYLLRHGGGGAYEANPLARWVLRQHGWLGLAGFKTATMGVAAVLALVVAWHNPPLGRRLLTACCLALAGVVVYSTVLTVRVRRGPEALAGADAAPILAQSRRIDARLRLSEDYRAVVESVVDDLERGSCNLDDGVDRLAGTAMAQDPAWFNTLRALYSPIEDPRPLLAASLVQHTLIRQLGRPGFRPLLERLRQDYRSTFGLDLPDHPSRLTNLHDDHPPQASL